MIKCVLMVVMGMTNEYINFYRQKFDLPMGSPVSGVFACFILEFLELGPFQHILPKDATYYRYIDDAILIYPHDSSL